MSDEDWDGLDDGPLLELLERVEAERAQAGSCQVEQVRKPS